MTHQTQDSEAKALEAVFCPFCGSDNVGFTYVEDNRGIKHTTTTQVCNYCSSKWDNPNPHLNAYLRTQLADAQKQLAEVYAAGQKSMQERAAQVESWYDGHGFIRYSHQEYNKVRAVSASFGLLSGAINSLDILPMPAIRQPTQDKGDE